MVSYRGTFYDTSFDYHIYPVQGLRFYCYITIYTTIIPPGSRLRNKCALPGCLYCILLIVLYCIAAVFFLLRLFEINLLAG